MAEHVIIETDSIMFVMFASHAGTEFPNDLFMQSKYTHMDFIALEINENLKPNFKGVLPEIWGLDEMSDEVYDMLIPPSEQGNLSYVPPNICDRRVCQNKE